MTINPSILLLTRDAFPSKRAVINKLWCKIIPKNSAKLIWVTESRRRSHFDIFKGDNLSIIGYSISKRNNLFFRTIKSVIQKFRISNHLAKKQKINQVQARNGVTDGLICILLKIIYGLPFSFHLSSLHGFEDSQLVKYNSGFPKVKIKLVNLFHPVFYKIIFHYASLVQPISESMGSYLHLNAGLDRSKIFPIPVSALKEEIIKGTKRELSSNPKIVYVGTLASQRDISFIFKVLAKVIKSKPEVHFRIIGNLEKNMNVYDLQKRLIELDINNKTEIFLNVSSNKVLELINECDLGVSSIKPLRKYIVSTPTKTIEYLSCGLPVVCNSEILDHKFIINNSQAGCAVPYSVDEFCEAIMSILENKDIYSNMSEKGRQWIFENRTYDDLALNLMKSYNSLIN